VSAVRFGSIIFAPCAMLHLSSLVSLQPAACTSSVSRTLNGHRSCGNWIARDLPIPVDVRALLLWSFTSHLVNFHADQSDIALSSTPCSRR